MKIFYIKTTETCNLNCSHCFTSGINGRKIYFDPIKTGEWVAQFGQVSKEECHLDFHGGEPFLAPLKDLYTFHRIVKEAIPHASFGATTNLTYKLTSEILEFMDTVLNKRVATSWDEGIRWDNDKQYNLWKNNVSLLIERGYTIKCFISMNTQLCGKSPIEVLLMLRNLGIHEVAFERLTHDGSANRNPDIFPTNKVIDDWIYELHLASIELGTHEWIENVLLDSIYNKFEKG